MTFLNAAAKRNRFQSGRLLLLPSVLSTNRKSQRLGFETNTRLFDVEMKNESIFQRERERKKNFFSISSEIFSLPSIHSFLPFLLEKWNPRWYFFLLFSMGWNQSLLLESSSSSHPIDPNFRNEKLKSKDPKKEDVRNFCYKSFFSICLIFYLWGLF